MYQRIIGLEGLVTFIGESGRISSFLRYWDVE
jgi:hypothetical protein